jgi:hypothetical protein
MDSRTGAGIIQVGSATVSAVSLRISSSFSRRPFSSPSVLIRRRQSANCSSVSATTFYSLSTSSVWRYSIFFMSVSSSSLYFMIFLSSAAKIFQRPGKPVKGNYPREARAYLGELSFAL